MLGIRQSLSTALYANNDAAYPIPLPLTCNICDMANAITDVLAGHAPDSTDRAEDSSIGENSDDVVMASRSAYDEHGCFVLHPSRHPARHPLPTERPATGDVAHSSEQIVPTRHRVVCDIIHGSMGTNNHPRLTMASRRVFAGPYVLVPHKHRHYRASRLSHLSFPSKDATAWETKGKKHVNLGELLKPTLDSRVPSKVPAVLRPVAFNVSTMTRKGWYSSIIGCINGYKAFWLLHKQQEDVIEQEMSRGIDPDECTIIPDLEVARQTAMDQREILEEAVQQYRTWRAEEETKFSDIMETADEFLQLAEDTADDSHTVMERLLSLVVPAQEAMSAEENSNGNINRNLTWTHRTGIGTLRNPGARLGYA